MNLVGIDQSFWFKTWPAIFSNLVLVLFVVFKRPPLFKYLLVFALTTLADILVASKIVAMPDDTLQTAVEYVFVLIGDLRFILLLAYFLYAGLGATELQQLSLPGSVIKPAFIFTLFPTILVGAVGFAKPHLLTEARHKFLAYELIFFILTVLWIYIVLPQKNLSAASARFVKSAALPVFLFYGLWSLADILILRGVEAGYAIRIVPNFLYYSVFLWWIHLAHGSSFGAPANPFSTLRAE
ncbi:hypothetical protein [Turneriella parva]|uniref:YhhN family protein n=1 Tax=Turneriella parva (strain ATCC BAA-1111 / DSM 21527 / NCTC 11395 / H) TaxID=869212 RepID=I4B1L7_TURPD|nr:hypothetical protein [Turneriella parva]AFM11174.1 hypothetical protein Turpa_0520 [Turneriella parva DSM 21527]